MFLLESIAIQSPYVYNNAISLCARVQECGYLNNPVTPKTTQVNQEMSVGVKRVPSIKGFY